MRCDRLYALHVEVRGPIVHQPAPPLEQVRAGIGGFDLILDHVPERRLDDLARVIRSCARCARTGGTGHPLCHKRSMNTGLGRPCARRISVDAKLMAGVTHLKSER